MQPHSPLMKYHVNKSQAQIHIPKRNIWNVISHCILSFHIFLNIRNIRKTLLNVMLYLVNKDHKMIIKQKTQKYTKRSSLFQLLIS